MNRKRISEKVLKAIFSKSGNICAFPGCNERIVYDDYKVMGEVAHIEAYSSDGPRYNLYTKEEEKNSAENLICLCCNHHKLIDSYPDIYTTEYLTRIKKEHEKKYDGTYSFEFDKIFELNKDLSNYMNQMKELNKKNFHCLKKQIKTDLDFQKTVTIIKSDVKRIDMFNGEIAQFLNSLNDKIIEKMTLKGIDTELWKDEYDFVLPLWEIYSIGIPNNLNDIKIYTTQLEILYYYEKLKTEYDETIKKQLQNAKRRYKRYCKNAIVYD